MPIAHCLPSPVNLDASELIIEIRSQSELNGANGAFSKDTNKIYIAYEYLSSVIVSDREAISTLTSLLLEEYGHYLDFIINGDNDSTGDEGAIFSALVMGESLDDETLQALKSEDDTATIIIDGQLITVEMQDFTGTDGNNLINGTSGDDNINGLGGNDTINGLGGNDVLDPGAGIDSIIGGTGNDILYINYVENGITTPLRIKPSGLSSRF